MRNAVLFLLLLGSFVGSAQDYLPLRPLTPHYFLSPDSLSILKGRSNHDIVLKGRYFRYADFSTTDSVRFYLPKINTIQTDPVYVHETKCLEDVTHQWLCDSVVLTDSVMFLYPGVFTKEWTIHNDRVDENQFVRNLSSNEALYLETQSVYQDEILGELDSIRVMKFVARSRSNPEIEVEFDAPYANQLFHISKNHGFLDLVFVPDFKRNWEEVILNDDFSVRWEMVGWEGNDMGFENPSFSDIYAPQVGDLFQIHDVQGHIWWETQTYATKRVIAREDIGASVKVTWVMDSLDFHDGFGRPTEKYGIDTFEREYSDNHFFNSLPGEVGNIRPERWPLVNNYEVLQYDGEILIVTNPEWQFKDQYLGHNSGCFDYGFETRGPGWQIFRLGLGETDNLIPVGGGDHPTPYNLDTQRKLLYSFINGVEKGSPVHTQLTYIPLPTEKGLWLSSFDSSGMEFPPHYTVKVWQESYDHNDQIDQRYVEYTELFRIENELNENGEYSERADSTYIGNFYEDPIHAEVHWMNSANRRRQVIFDYDLEVGDTLTIPWDYLDPLKLVVSDIEEKVLYGETRRVWTLDHTTEDYAYEWIEGVGYSNAGPSFWTFTERESLDLYCFEKDVPYDESDCRNVLLPITGTDISFEVYPNPTRGLIRFESEQEYKLYSVEGIELENGKGVSIDLSFRPTGTYILNLNEKKVRVSKT